MARFASEAELETFLGRLDPDYSQFASSLWQNGVRTARQLANATKPLLLSWGLPELYIDDIKATADKTCATGLSEEQLLRLDTLFGYVERQVKKKSVSLSKVGSVVWNEIQENARLTVIPYSGRMVNH
ncbi:TPA: hypothetical protein ACH3X1_002895 [Trebouxia sp. C0004]